MTAGRHPRYEPRDVRPSSVARMTAGFFAGIAVSAGLVAALIGVLSRDAGRPLTRPVTPQPSSASTPRLEIPEGRDRAELEAAARQKLEGYGWADRQAGRVRVPIERAMELLVERGWPDRGEP